MTPDIRTAEWSSGLLEQVLGAPDAVAGTIGLAWALESTAWSIIDSGKQGWPNIAHGDTAFHVLHADPSGPVRPTVRLNDIQLPIQAGNTFFAFPNDRFTVSPGVLLAVFINARPSTRRFHRVDHGSKSALGRNSRTTFAASQRLAIERWTMTEPFRLVSTPQCPLLCIDGRFDLRIGRLTGEMRAGQSLAFFGEVDLLPQGEATVLTMWDPDVGSGPGISLLV